MTKFTGTILFNFEAEGYTDAQATILAALSGVAAIDIKKIDLASWGNVTPSTQPANQ